MTTKLKIGTFKIVLSWRKKNTGPLGDLPLRPQCSPAQKRKLRKFYFYCRLAVSDRCKCTGILRISIMLCGFLDIRSHLWMSLERFMQADHDNEVVGLPQVAPFCVLHEGKSATDIDTIESENITC